MSRTISPSRMPVAELARVQVTPEFLRNSATSTASIAGDLYSVAECGLFCGRNCRGDNAFAAGLLLQIGRAWREPWLTFRITIFAAQRQSL
jgi:hypothetical protein